MARKKSAEKGKRDFKKKCDELMTDALKVLENKLEKAAEGDDSIKVSDLSTVIKTLYDKGSFSEGETDKKIEIHVELVDN